MRLTQHYQPVSPSLSFSVTLKHLKTINPWIIPGLQQPLENRLIYWACGKPSNYEILQISPKNKYRPSTKAMLLNWTFISRFQIKEDITLVQCCNSITKINILLKFAELQIDVILIIIYHLVCIYIHTYMYMCILSCIVINLVISIHYISNNPLNKNCLQIDEQKQKSKQTKSYKMHLNGIYKNKFLKNYLKSLEP